MKFIKNFILILLFILPISNVICERCTHLDTDGRTFNDGGTSCITGIEFNPDGTKMFVFCSTNGSGYYIDVIYII